MPWVGLEQDVIAQILALRADGMFQKDIAAQLGIGQATVNRYLKIAAKKGELIGEPPAWPGFEITKVVSKGEDGETITQRPEADEVVIPDGHIIERASIKVGDSWFKTKLAPTTLTRDDLLQIFGEYRGKAELIPFPNLLLNQDLATAYTMSDLHLGMLAWGRETGASWDLKIAHDTILSSMTELVQCSPPAGTAVLLDLGDYTHNNNQTNVTPGHAY